MKKPGELGTAADIPASPPLRTDSEAGVFRERIRWGKGEWANGDEEVERREQRERERERETKESRRE